MADTVLTDTEVRDLMKRSSAAFQWPDLGYTRTVEAAVLAKMQEGRPRYWIDKNGKIRQFDDAVTEVEARERERKAFVLGWLSCPASGIQPISETQARRDRDTRYPSLIPKPVEPPPLVLSTGRYRKPSDGGRWQKDMTPVEYITVDAPICRTPADARALAEWLERWSGK